MIDPYWAEQQMKARDAEAADLRAEVARLREAVEQIAIAESSPATCATCETIKQHCEHLIKIARAALGRRKSSD